MTDGGVRQICCPSPSSQSKPAQSRVPLRDSTACCWPSQQIAKESPMKQLSVPEAAGHHGTQDDRTPIARNLDGAKRRSPFGWLLAISLVMNGGLASAHAAPPSPPAARGMDWAEIEQIGRAHV